MKEIDAQFWTMFLMILVGNIKMKATEAVNDVIYESSPKFPFR